LKAKKTLLFVRHGLSFDETQVEIKMNFNITDERHSGDRKLQNTGNMTLIIAELINAFIHTIYIDLTLSILLFLPDKDGKIGKGKKKEEEIIHSIASTKIWRLLRTNSSAVHLHVLVLKDMPAGHPSGDTYEFCRVTSRILSH
jgi:hypothetical protein